MKQLLTSFIGIGTLCFASISANAKETYVYDWLTMGKKTGSQVVVVEGNKITADYEFSDRGRGPKIHEEIIIDANGLPVSRKISGHSYMGASVDETYQFKDGIASWKNTQEQGSVKLKQNKYYNAANSSLEALAVMMRAILASPNQQLELLPSGTARAEKLTSIEVEKPAENGENNVQKTISLFAVYGLGFTPSYVWMDQEKQLFAGAYGWMGIAQSGWGHTLEKLQKLQDQARDNLTLSKAKQFTQNLEGITLIKNVNIFDAVGDALIEDSAVAIQDGRIIAMGKAALTLDSKKVLDGKGKTLMPGLWDMHTHISLNSGLMHIAAGVTSIRDLANRHEQVMEATEFFAEGKAIGPQVYRAGFVDQKSPYAAPTGKLAETLDEALAHIDWYAERGYPQIKIYSSITPEWVKPIAERVHKHGMKLSGHIPSFMTTSQAVKDGFDEIQHLNMLFLNFLAGPEDDTRTPVRFTLVGEKAGDLDLDSEEVTQFIQLLKDKNVVVDPTITIFHSMFVNKAGEIDPNYAAIAEHVPASVKRSFLSAELEIPQDKEKAYARSADALLKLVKKLHDAGVRIVPGTDAMAGFTLHRELELYSMAGIPNTDVLKIATVNSANVVGADNVGTIQVGKAADIILVDGNPIKDINAIRKVALVIKGDKMFKPEKLYSSIGIKPFTTF